MLTNVPARLDFNEFAFHLFDDCLQVVPLCECQRDPKSRTTRVSRYQKGKTRKVKTNLDLLEQEILSGSGISWTICKLQVCTSYQITTPTSHHSVFLQAGCPSWRQTNSVKALKETSVNRRNITKSFFIYTLFFGKSPTSQTGQWIFCARWLKWCGLTQRCAFWGFIDIAVHYRGQIPPKPQFLECK